MHATSSLPRISVPVVRWSDLLAAGDGRGAERASSGGRFRWRGGMDVVRRGERAMLCAPTSKIWLAVGYDLVSTTHPRCRCSASAAIRSELYASN